MSKLHTSYLGLKLKNPLIVSSSSLTSNIESIEKLADAGAGAVVLKSLFEEQIQAETNEMGETLSHAEAYDYIEQMGMSLGPAQYLELVRESKSRVDIPVIASLNCVDGKWWKEYAVQLDSAGADALEVNLSLMPRRFDQKSGDLEKELIHTVETIRKHSSLPLAIKLGPYFTSLPEFATRLQKAGADALVLFNRFYQFDFDLSTGQPKGRVSLSSPEDYHQALRWISILFDRAGVELAASTGVHNAETALKMIAAGADAVQLCSVFYRNNTQILESILRDMEVQLDSLGVSDIQDLKGRYAQKRSEKPESYERLQYIKALTGLS
ncbi:dihydroorotate dehydrogenase-like protein [Salinispira pacifica]|uniref:Putative dihydropyrimidine dehydrogenase [NADP+], similar to dihydroorotate dehydrogenase n=1 Tax=Salinispira pacifica TaxID=1307761 RepID=V5WHH6_9SPIO|nr:dihydroorotate dehydrogenase-like protein [Salinispira pacifica]AHC15055.1 Putative dihydropyrimidine dehydrogenase [NADP+], similar to dihydroorotate dehydrogenase [Salinispira pacifica]